MQRPVPDHARSPWILRLALLALCLGLWAPAPLPDARAQDADEDADAVSEEDAAPSREDVVRYPVMGQLDGSFCRRVAADLEEIAELGYQHVILEIDTPGGELFASQELSQAIYGLRKRGLTTYAWIPSNGEALSAGTIIALACEHLSMGENTRLGDVQPIQITFGGDIKELPEKIQTVVRTDLVYYATEHGFPKALVEAMVSKDMVVYRVRERDARGNVVTHFYEEAALPEAGDVVHKELIVGSGKLLTISEREAIEYGFITIVHPTIDALRNDFALHGKLVEARELTAGGFIVGEHFLVVHWLNWGVIRFLLVVLGMLGLVLEAKIPGISIAGLAAVACFSLYFAGPILVGGGTLAWTAVLVFLVAMVLLAVEMFLIPGFGVAGVLGLLLLLTGLAMSYPSGSEPVSVGGVASQLMVVVSGLGLSVLLLVAVLQLVPGLRGTGGLISRATLEGSAGEAPVEKSTGLDAASLIGQVGTTVTALRPAGKIDLGGQLLHVVTGGDFVEPGVTVEVVEVEGNRILVCPTGGAA